MDGRTPDVLAQQQQQQSQQRRQQQLGQPGSSAEAGVNEEVEHEGIGLHRWVRRMKSFLS
jgi:hypothetical protein